MTIPRIAYLFGLALVIGGAIGLYAGGMWADEYQQAGPAWLWLIPLTGVGLILAGMVLQARSHRSGN